MRLPATVPPRAGQALDSYLETVADTNDLTTADLLRLVTDPDGASTRFLTLQPSSLLLARLADLTDTSPDQLKAMTLAGLPHHEPWDLTGFDPDARHAFTSIGNRGWLRTHGSQLCPACLDDTGAWQLAWRLQTTTCCTRHHTYLATHCPTCRRPFRDQRSTPLRPVGAALTCGNARRHGRDARCRRDLTRILTLTAPDDELDRQHHHDHALAGATDNLLGEPVAPSDYLAETRHLACLLLHLAGQPGAQELAAWAAEIQHLNGGGRTPWATKPPDDSRHRSLALTEAHRILTAPTRDKAADRLTPWILLIPRGAEGPIGWASDRTRLTPHVARVLFSSLNPQRRLSHLLDASAPLTRRLNDIPQQVPADLYAQHLAGLTSTTTDTGRLFASLCLARSHPDVTTWPDAAEALGLDPDLGRRTAVAASARTHANPTKWVEHLTHLAQDLTPTDYREHETAVKRLTGKSRWYTTWRHSRPGTRTTSRDYALTWLWIHHAGGLLATTPAPTGNEPGFRAQYKRFAATLTSEHQSELRRALRRDQH